VGDRIHGDLFSVASVEAIPGPGGTAPLRCTAGPWPWHRDCWSNASKRS